MTDLAALSSSPSATTAASASGRKHAHGAQFQSLMSSAGDTGTSQSASQTATVSTSTASATGSVSGALGGLQHVLDLLQGATA